MTMLESGSRSLGNEDPVPTVEELLASLETKVDAIADLRTMISSLRTDMVRGFELVDKRFDQVDKRLEQVDARFKGLDQRFDRTERRNESLDDRMDRHFLWLLGVQMTVLIAIVAVLLRALAR